MPRRLRFQPEPWSYFFVTTNCLQRRFLLVPSPQVNELVVGILAKARQKYAVRLFAVCVLSNHYHLLVQAKSAASLSSFMQYINSNIARKIGAARRWSGRFWHRRYQASIVLDEPALLDRMKYIFKNSVKEGLVKHPRYWPGVHCYDHLCERRPLRGIWFNETARSSKGGRTGRGRTEPVELSLDQLPSMAHLSKHEYSSAMRQLARDALSQIEQPDAFLGQIRILNTDPQSAPRKVQKSPAPPCHSSCTERMKVFHNAYHEFAARYREAMEAVQLGIKSRFPSEGLPHICWSMRTAGPG